MRSHDIGNTYVVLRILQANVLISNDNPPRACLTDFGLNAIMFDVFSMSKASVNWTAPEIFAPGERDFKPTYASDTYALGMLIYEVTFLPCIQSHFYRFLPSVGAHRTFPILLQTHEGGIGISGRSREQATASAPRLREVGNYGLSMEYYGNLLGRKGFRETPGRERRQVFDAGREGLGRGRFSVFTR